MDKKKILIIGSPGIGMAIAKHIAMNKIGIGMFITGKQNEVPAQFEKNKIKNHNLISDLYDPKIGTQLIKEKQKSKYHK